MSWKGKKAIVLRFCRGRLHLWCGCRLKQYKIHESEVIGGIQLVEIGSRKSLRMAIAIAEFEYRIRIGGKHPEIVFPLSVAEMASGRICSSVKPLLIVTGENRTPDKSQHLYPGHRV